MPFSFAGDNTLGRFTRDLTAESRAGKLEPVRCREEEISRVIDILLRQSKNNPALVGPAGVGKTAIAEGLAQRVTSGAVPFALRDMKLLALDHVSLLAGTMYRGQYEERIRAIVAEASADPDTVLFIDELHNLIGQGTAMGAAMDAANMLKPALVRGDFRVIGATTDDEYERWVCGDPALERRFQKLTVRELSAEQTLEILRARKEGLERHHNVTIAEDALVASVDLTDRYVTDRMRPDRAIDALDEACAHTQALATPSPETEALIRQRKVLLREAVSVGARQEAPAETRAPQAEEDPLGRVAREGFAARAAFGAELYAVLSGDIGAGRRAAQPVGAVNQQQASTAGAPEPPRPSVPMTPSRLSALELELQRRLMEEGLVVRAHDIARVVAIATGEAVRWDG
jgi:ATP-dependent Clp protease ATP-binding subunit ClpA